MKLEEFRVYQMSMDLGEEVWDIVIKWDYFAKDIRDKEKSTRLSTNLV